MKLPAKVEYAYKAVAELALRYDSNTPIQINTICKEQDVPKKFLIQLLIRLKNANIVASSRGLAGGYYLTRPPSRISIADVVRAIDETIIGNAKAARTSKGNDSGVVLLRVWSEIDRKIVGYLEGVTFDKIVSQLKNEQLTYNI
jgi:Rrf2 family iron-sulfur cluster assembly transcriptional regulator